MDIYPAMIKSLGLGPFPLWVVKMPFITVFPYLSINKVVVHDIFVKVKP